MPILGSFALLLSLVLAAYSLVMGAIAQRQISTGSQFGAAQGRAGFGRRNFRSCFPADRGAARTVGAKRCSDQDDAVQFSAMEEYPCPVVRCFRAS
jgi:hypothetical protein